MQYAALIYENEAEAAQPGTPEADEIFQRYMSFTQDISAEGVNKGGEALYPATSATTVRIRNGELQVTDGPFAETKEQLGGFYLIEAEDLDQAVSIAARIPASETGSIELRPVWDFSQAG
jgi:hypothetical protein